MARSIIMIVIALLVVVYVGLYVFLSVPSIQNKIKMLVCEETSLLLGGKIGIESLTVLPFSEVILSEVSLDSPDGDRCASIKKVAAGIDLWRLVADRKIVLNYAEIIGLDVKVVQDSLGAPTNIQFLIDALSPKDKTKPPTLFDLKIRNVVIRESKASYIRRWMIDNNGNSLPFAEMKMERLRMDLSIPVLKNDFYKFLIRNMQFEITPNVTVRSLSADVEYVKDEAGISDRLIVKDFNISLPNSSLNVADIDLNLADLSDIDTKLTGLITPSDFAGLLPQLNSFDSPWNLKVDAHYINNCVEVAEFAISNDYCHSYLNFNGNVGNINNIDSLNLNVSSLKADFSEKIISGVCDLIPKISDKVKGIINSAGNVFLEFDGSLTDCDKAKGKGMLSTGHGKIDFDAEGKFLKSKRPQFKIVANAEDLDVGTLLNTDKVGAVSLAIDADFAGLDKNVDGVVSLSSDELVLVGNKFQGVDFEIRKSKSDIAVVLDASSGDMRINLEGGAVLDGVNSLMQTNVELSNFNPSQFGLKGKMADCIMSTNLHADTKGNNPDNITGELLISNLNLVRNDGQTLILPELSVSIDSIESASMSHYEFGRYVIIASDWVDARIYGDINPTKLIPELKEMLSSVFPTLISPKPAIKDEFVASNNFTFNVNVKGVSAPYVFFNTPVRPLLDIPINGEVNAKKGKANISFSTPHLQQGKNKLIRNAGLDVSIDSFLGMAKMTGGLIFPAKKGDVEIATDLSAMHDKVNINIGLNPTMESAIKGGISLETSFSRIPNPFKPNGDLAVDLNILPSTITVSGTPWTIADGFVDYSSQRVSVSNFLISHDNQYVKIDGVASESPSDRVKIMLNDIDLEYIFNILNINYVSFGGMATGEVVGSQLLTKSPMAKTEFLHVKGLSYNGAELGDGDLASDYDADVQKVGIYAVIRDPLTRQRKVSVNGGIWVTRDSLSFDFDADKVNVGIMKPFVSAFCSDLDGKASGKCKLYGSFSDIDLTGALLADTISMKLDFTNTWYHAGNDSVFLKKGLIDIPPLTLYDDEGHSAEFSGWLRHTYFHNPVFNFKLRDAKSILCYNTNEAMNPLWYGTIYGTGHGQINGEPGVVEIDINMETEANSKFYYVISDAEDVAQYSFLTFTDKRKEKMEAAKSDTIPEYLKKFQKESQEMEEGSSNVILSLKGTVNNDALVTLVMDPKAGDNITARGQGALQMDYNMANNDLRMIGTYILDEGNYNFTLQDIIIKNFNIKKGSLIKFDGDPMNANLDIAATYRVNTNLTDLDKSFANDKELNRTNVPVDALLIVKGPMTNPDISFDIELPTLTSDVERKVKSLVSTNDMMSRQIIYLLALNRFYTPEYTGGQSNGSEWSSMASSTLSSQLSNILSQMTDKLDVAPSFRSEKGDFSDMEFDLALSSRLLNNRLLINGNFGYRDKNTSNTQFVGDFDIEYLLNKNGNLRLKAYNHFNDQNYYLRSALTTQGVGVVFRLDFDRLFRKKKEEEQNDDSVSANDPIEMEPNERGLEIIKNDQ
ncbi:MAG: translocation/assembly module TamB [Muribaculaceae bacterium]|nr:translocation/assembly module TamB [Muribaculaceae bacterium]